jgi:non-homologous end joining protein Ku
MDHEGRTLSNHWDGTKDNYIIITDDEIASAQKEKSDSIEIINFVERSEIPPVYYSDSYYLSPEKVGVDLFALLHTAMIDTGKWDASKYHDEYNEIIMAVIKRKTDPLVQPIQEAPKPQTAKVVNIMDALKAAVEATGRAKAVNE